MANSTVYQSKWKQIVESRRAKPDISLSPNPLLKFYEESVMSQIPVLT